MNNTPVSAGLGFMRAAFNGIGKSVGDRERSKLLHEAMEIAIKGKMAFDLDDVEPMNRLQMSTSVGVFRPFSDHNYFTACLAGGTFCRLWEKAFDFKPFKAPLVAISTSEVLKDNRVAPGVALLVPGDDTDLMMPRFQDLQVWWCTSLSTSKDTITLSRYRLTEDRRYPFSREGHPANLKRLTRATWKDFICGANGAEQ
ncbi:hypothetical protein M770_31640 (plasmid) [Pseudomonas aeruginosa VRFPA03]|nr:hypothetical protein M770_31640 [Pseudomonas aeruginosa VRFPA03]